MTSELEARRSRLKKHITIAVSLAFIFTIVLIAIFLSGYPIDFEGKVDSAIVNGILTGNAIVFSFVAYELREIKMSIFDKFAFSLPLLFSITFTVLNYAKDAIKYGYATNMSLIIAIGSFVFAIMFYPVVGYAKDSIDELENQYKKES